MKPLFLSLILFLPLIAACSNFSDANNEMATSERLVIETTNKSGTVNNLAASYRVVY